MTASRPTPLTLVAGAVAGDSLDSVAATVGYRRARVHEERGASPYASDGRERLSLGIKADRILEPSGDSATIRTTSQTNSLDFVDIRPAHTYLICATQRSGSTLLCELLKQTGVAGCPEEYFEAQFETGVPPHPRRFLEGLVPTGAGVRANVSPPDAPEYSSLYGITSYREHLTRTLQRGTTTNGVFGAKLMFNQLPELSALAGTLPEYAGLAPIALLRALFGDPAFVWVSRGDKVRQAVSMWKALQSRHWRGERSDGDPRAPGGSGPPRRARYSYEGIDHLVGRFEADDQGWNDFFAVNELAPLRITYEDLARDREGTARAVLSAIGVSPPAEWSAPEPTRRQGDALSEEWVAAYHRDRTERNHDGSAAGVDVGAV